MKNKQNMKGNDADDMNTQKSTTNDIHREKVVISSGFLVKFMHMKTENL